MDEVVSFDGADDGVVEEELRGEVAGVVEDDAFDVLDVGGFFIVLLGVLEAEREEFGEDEVVEVFFGDIGVHKEVLCHMVFD